MQNIELNEAIRTMKSKKIEFMVLHTFMKNNGVIEDIRIMTPKTTVLIM